MRGDFQIPKWLSAGARNLIRRTLDPNPNTRITMAGIKEDEWFKTEYNPASPCYDDEEGPFIDEDDAISTHDEVYLERNRNLAIFLLPSALMCCLTDGILDFIFCVAI